MSETPLPEATFDLAAFHAGRIETINDVYVAHGAALQRDLRRYTGAAEAEAVVHDVFVDLIRKAELRARFLGGALFAWLRQIARFKALEHLRRERRPLPDDLPGEAASPEPGIEARDALARFVAKGVPAKQLAFFTLRFLEDRTQVEVAARLGVPRSTLEGWEHALEGKLRKFLMKGAK